jgi:acyl-CoA synthetase (AMP-forming)/AMP-acid ligase II
VLPALREHGVDEAQITAMLVHNPRPLLHRRPGVSPTAVIEIPRTHNPYPRQGVQADDHGIPRYTELPESLIAMLARHVETGPDVEAVVEVGGQRLAYQQLWDRRRRPVRRGRDSATGTRALPRAVGGLQDPQYIVVSGRPLPRNPAGKFLKAQLRKSVEWGAPL